MRKQDPTLGSDGTLEQAMEKVWDLYMGGKASYISTRRYLEKLDAFDEKDITKLMATLMKDREELMGF